MNITGSATLTFQNLVVNCAPKLNPIVSAHTFMRQMGAPADISGPVIMFTTTVASMFVFETLGKALGDFINCSSKSTDEKSKTAFKSRVGLLTAGLGAAAAICTTIASIIEAEKRLQS